MAVPTVAVCIRTREKTEEFAKLVSSLRGHVDKIIAAVPPGSEEFLEAVKKIADGIIRLPPEGYDKKAREEILAMADSEYLLTIESNETLEHPERLRDLAATGISVLFMPRHTWISGYHSNCFGSHDFRGRMFSCRNSSWEMFERYSPQGSVDFGRYFECECWLNRHLEIEEIRQDPMFWCRLTLADIEEPEDVTLRRLELIELEYKRRLDRKENIKILFRASELKKVGETLAISAAFREAKRLYPKSEVTLETSLPEAIGPGPKKADFIYESINPYVDYIDTAHPNHPDKMNLLEKYDIIADWGESMTRQGYDAFQDCYQRQQSWGGFEPEDGNYKPDWFFTEDEKKFADNWVKKQCATKRIIGVAMTAGSVRRCWPLVEDFINALQKEFPDVTVVGLGRLEKKLSDMSFLRRIFGMKLRVISLNELTKAKWHDPKRFINAAFVDDEIKLKGFFNKGKRGLTLRQQAAILPHLDLLVTPDSGLMHIAAALEVPTVAYFNVLRPELRIKYFPWISPLNVQFNCAPCYNERYCEKMSSETPATCMQNLTVDMTMSEVRKRLAEGRGE